MMAENLGGSNVLGHIIFLLSDKVLINQTPHFFSYFTNVAYYKRHN